MIEITSLTNKLIKQFVSLKTKKQRDESKLFILDDIDLIKKADEMGLLEYYLFSSKQNKDIKKCNNIIKTTNIIIDKISSLETTPNGIGICKFNNFTDDYSNKIICLDDVQDPGNGGTILRSAIAFDFNTMLLSESSFDLYNEKFIRATKGAFFDATIKRLNLEKELLKLKKNGYEIVIADLDKDAIKLKDYKMAKKTCIVVGNEGNGISDKIKKIASKIVYIPISSKMESLNVGVAASIIMSKNAS